MKNLFLCSARLGAAALVLLAAGACSGLGDNTAQASPPPSPAAPVAGATPPNQDLWKQIEAEVGDAACDAPTQCRTIAVGSKACGGPQSYLAWSTKRSNGERLKQLAEKHAAASRAADARQGMVSNCAMVMDPGATCVAQRCVLQQGGAGASAR